MPDRIPIPLLTPGAVLTLAGVPAAIVTAVLAFAVFPCARDRDRCLLNLTGSVPPGLYVAADPDTAGFASFCLPALPAGVRHDPRLCSADNPAGVPVLKRVTAVTGSGVILEGNGDSALDSRVFGAVPVAEILGFWRPRLTIDGFESCGQRCHCHESGSERTCPTDAWGRHVP